MLAGKISDYPDHKNIECIYFTIFYRSFILLQEIEISKVTTFFQKINKTEKTKKINLIRLESLRIFLLSIFLLLIADLWEIHTQEPKRFDGELVELEEGRNMRGEDSHRNERLASISS